MDSRGKAGLHVIFGNGPVGSAAARFLLQKGLPVRLVSRSGRRPAVLFDGLPVDQERRLEFRAADALDLQAVVNASNGASHIYHCANVLYQDWGKVLPSLQQNLVTAALRHGSVLAVADNLYMYARGVSVIDESTAEVPPTRKGLLRKGPPRQTRRGRSRQGPFMDDGARLGLLRSRCSAAEHLRHAAFPGPPFQRKDGPGWLAISTRLTPIRTSRTTGRPLSLQPWIPARTGSLWIVPNDRDPDGPPGGSIVLRGSREGRATRHFSAFPDHRGRPVQPAPPRGEGNAVSERRAVRRGRQQVRRAIRLQGDPDGGRRAANPGMVRGDPPGGTRRGRLTVTRCPWTATARYFCVFSWVSLRRSSTTFFTSASKSG